MVCPKIGIMLSLPKAINFQVILKYKDNLIFVIIMFLALAGALRIYKSQSNRTESMKEEIAREEQRIAAAKELSSLDTQISQSAQGYIKGKESWDKGAFQRLASLSEVKMVSFNPQGGPSGDYFTVDAFGLEARGGYHNLAKFISLLESQKDIVQIEKLALKSLAREGEDLSLILSVGITYIKAQ